MRARTLFPLLALVVGACRQPQPAARPPATGTVPPPGPLSAACEGDRLDLLGAIANPQCRITEQQADALREALEDPKRASVRVEAAWLADGRVSVRIVNAGATTLALPLFVHSHVDTFTTRADGRALEAPLADWPPSFSFEIGRMLSQITLHPGGTAEATLTINDTLVTQEYDCPPDAKCAPKKIEHGRLAPGTYMLGIRTPLYAARADLEARLTWSVP